MYSGRVKLQSMESRGVKCDTVIQIQRVSQIEGLIECELLYSFIACGRIQRG